MYNNTVDKDKADSNYCADIQPYTPPPPPSVGFCSRLPISKYQSHQPNPRKMRTKLIKLDSHSFPTTTSTSRPKYAGKKPDPSAPKITRPCSECGKKFWSWKALFGHMRCHPERQWRGINPPPNLITRRSTTSSSLDYDSSSKITPEDHEVASCLLMLANAPPAAQTSDHSPSVATAGTILSQGMLETTTTTTTEEEDAYAAALGDGDVEGGGGVPSASTTSTANANTRFECSSCNKVFGSPQALGGHRASHKNVKGCFAITRNNDGVEGDYRDRLINIATGGIHGEDHRSPHSQLGDDQVVKVSGEDNNNNKSSTSTLMAVMGVGVGGHHQCSICLRVFSSGQALGGHKRCHWEKLDEPPPEERPDSGSCLDLNLPAALTPGVHDEDEDDDDSHSCYSSGGLALDLRLGL